MLDLDWVIVWLAGLHTYVCNTRTSVLARTLMGHGAGIWACIWLIGVESKRTMNLRGGWTSQSIQPR